MTLLAKAKRWLKGDSSPDTYPSDDPVVERPWTVSSHKSTENGLWYPNIRAANGEVTWTNLQGFRDRTDSDRAIERFMDIAKGAGFVIKLGTTAPKKPAKKK